MTKNNQFATPVGVVVDPYSAIFKADYGTKQYPNKKGSFKTSIEFKMSDFESNEKFKQFKKAMDEAVASLEPELDALKKKLMVAGKKKVADSLFVREPYLERYTEDGEPTGTIVIKAKTAASGVSKGKEWSREMIPVFDSSGNPITKPIPLAQGSKIQMNVTLGSPYCNEATGAGISLYLNAIMVHESVAYTGSTKDAGGFDFETTGSSYIYSEDDAIQVKAATDEDIAETTTGADDGEDF